MYPFFSFFGGKYRVAPKYPKPIYDTIIEPFAGSAGYSVRYFDKNIILYEIDPKIAAVWDYLIHVTPEEVLSLPLIFDHIDDCKICNEAKWLIGFWIAKGRAVPGKTPSAWFKGGTRPCSYWGKTIRERIATQIEHIRHWTVFNNSYETAEQIEATWYIDPPYQDKGKFYKYHDIDYSKLGQWCRNLPGQVMVCENKGADWLPFKPFYKIQGTHGKYRTGTSEEVIWTNSI